MERQRLANGSVTVWQENGGMVIHHANGLTIALSVEEAIALFDWMNEQKPGSENEPDQRMTDVQREQALDRMRIQMNPCGICGSHKFGCTFIDLPGVKHPVIICASCLEQHKKNLESEN